MRLPGSLLASVLLATLTLHFISPALGAQPPSEEADPVPAERAHPRATMQTFLAAFADNDVDRAVACLDLSQLSLTATLRVARGRELAIQLKDTIDRVAFVEVSTLPADPRGSPYVFAEVAGEAIVVAPNQRGEWLFSPETVAAIPEMARAVADREVVEGVVEAPRTLALWLRGRIPQRLRTTGFLLEHWQWLGLLTLTLVGLLLDRLVRLLLRRFLAARLAVLTKSRRVVRSVLRPWGLLAMALLWWFGLIWLGLPEQPLVVLHVAIEFVTIFALIWAVYRGVDVVAVHFARSAGESASRLDDLLVPIVRRSAKVLIVAFGLLFLADNLGLEISTLLAGVGLGGVAVALAAQDVIKNLFGSITVLVDRPFDVGDWITVGGLEGTVEEVGLRSTRIRTGYDSVVTLPNANLINTAVDNYGRRNYRRWRTKLGVAYETSPDQLEAFCRGIRELVLAAEHTRKDSLQVNVESFDESAINILLNVFFQVPSYATELEERQRLILQILSLADELGVEIAYPTRRLLLEGCDESG